MTIILNYLTFIQGRWLSLLSSFHDKSIFIVDLLLIKNLHLFASIKSLHLLTDVEEIILDIFEHADFANYHFSYRISLKRHLLTDLILNTIKLLCYLSAFFDNYRW